MASPLPPKLPDWEFLICAEQRKHNVVSMQGTQGLRRGQSNYLKGASFLRIFVLQTVAVSDFAKLESEAKMVIDLLEALNSGEGEAGTGWERG